MREAKLNWNSRLIFTVMALFSGGLIYMAAVLIVATFLKWWYLPVAIVLGFLYIKMYDALDKWLD